MNKILLKFFILILFNSFIVLNSYSQVSPLNNLIDNIQNNDQKDCVRKSYNFSNNVLTLTTVKCNIFHADRKDPTGATVSSDPANPVKITLAAGGRAELGFTYSFQGSEYLRIEYKLTGNPKVDVEISKDPPWNGIDIRLMNPGENTLKCVYKNYSDESAEVTVYFSVFLDAVEGNRASISNAYVIVLN